MTQEVTPSQAARIFAQGLCARFASMRPGDDIAPIVNQVARFEEQTRTATEREVVGRAAAVIDELARAETRAIKHADDPVTKGRCAVIAAEFRRASKLIRALSEQKS